MPETNLPEFLRSYCLRFTLWVLALHFLCLNSWAAQEAMVVVDRAVIYSDQEMTSPVGYISRGKKVMVGEIARNKGQVYPIIVSGKIAYIKVLDLTTERESLDTTRLTAERFQRQARDIPESKVVVSYFQFSPKIDVDSGKLDEALTSEPFNMHGASLKGEVLLRERFDLQVIINYLAGSKDDTRFNILEAGMGGALRLLDFKRFLLRAEAQLLAVPFSSYEVGNDFRVKSYGYSVGAGLAMTYLLGNNWGLEASGGVYRTQILNFKAPDPYQEISPTFTGARLGIGLNFSF